MDLKNQYRAMTEELRRYNDFRSSQSQPTTSEQPFQRLNLDTIQSNFLKIEKSTQSYRLGYSTTGRSDEASEPSSIDLEEKIKD